MTTIDISQTGIETNLINQKMNNGPLQTQPEPNKEKDDPIVRTDTVKITANITEKPVIEFEPIDEEQANILAQLVANDLSKQSFGISSQVGIDILRSFV
ncbi:MAG: hypothetical protein J7L66_03580 [Anaerolineaceae bacterium]|nr:hypothetical protein [Anaerolineaceae bacterium]